MRNISMTVAAGLMLISTGALADAADPVAAQPVAATTNTSKLVCHYQVHDGVFIRKQVCKTQEQWNRDRREAQRDFSTFQMRTYVAPFK